MNTHWTRLPSDVPGQSRYRRSQPRAEATIERREHALEAKMKTGWLGLGSRTASCHFDTSLSDQAVLSHLDEVAHPPRFSDWKPVQGQDVPGVTQYEGRETGGLIRSKVEATIVRVGDQATVRARAGWTGPSIEGAFFAPAPSDREILRRISY